ncbi:MAG: hypothetical protein Fur0025_39680 [Oscillatoriaceae cyanobacterium]
MTDGKWQGENEGARNRVSGLDLGEEAQVMAETGFLGWYNHPNIPYLAITLLPGVTHYGNFF